MVAADANTVSVGSGMGDGTFADPIDAAVGGASPWTSLCST